MPIRSLKNIGILTLNSKGISLSRLLSGLSFAGEKKWKTHEGHRWRRDSNLPERENGRRWSSTSTVSNNTIPVARKIRWSSLVSLFWTERATKLHEYVDENHRRLGPIFRDRVGPVDLIFLNSPDDFRKVFRLEGSTPMHFLPEAWHLYNKFRDCPRGLLFMEGAEWLHFRRIMNRVMLVPNPGDIMGPRCHEAARDLVEEWNNFADTSKTIEALETRLYRWSIEVMLATLVGSSWKSYKPRVEKQTVELAGMLHRIFEVSAKLSLLPVKYAMKFRLPLWREFCAAADLALGSVRSIVPEIMRYGGDGLVSLMVSEGITNEKDLVRIVTDLVIAAGDTTAYSTQWALFTLAKNPRIQDKLFERLKLLGPEEIGTDNYVRAIIRETLRLYPTAPFLTRFLPDDAIIAGHLVPKGELIIMSIYSSGRDPNNFPHPNEFRPERWLRNDAGNYEQVTNPHGSLPFALGARSCVGRKLAETQMIHTLSQIVKNFRIECPNADAIRMILHLIAVPSEPIRLKLYKR